MNNFEEEEEVGNQWVVFQHEKSSLVAAATSIQFTGEFSSSS